MTEPVQLALMGIATTELPLKHPRLLPYAQTYLASQSTIDAHRTEPCAFLHASHDGWRAALAQPDEAAALLTATDEHPSTMDASARLAEHRAMLARVALGEVPGPTKAFLVQAAPHEDAVRGLVFGLAKGRIDGLSAIKVSVKNFNSEMRYERKFHKGSVNEWSEGLPAPARPTSEAWKLYWRASPYRCSKRTWHAMGMRMRRVQQTLPGLLHLPRQVDFQWRLIQAGTCLMSTNIR